MQNTKLKLMFVTFLTVVRFPLVLLFVAGAVVYSLYGKALGKDWIYHVSFYCLACSAITDLFDGYFARRFNVETKFGAHADPLIDKFFYLASFPLLVFVAVRNNHTTDSVILLILTVLFLGRDQWVTFLRSIGSMYNVSGSANWAGKLRTIINFPLICCIYHYEEAPHNILNGTFIYAYEALAFGINFLSLYVYTKKYWPYVKQTISLKK